MESKMELKWWGGWGGLTAPATSTTQNFTKKIEKKIFGINVYKIAKEKLSLGFGVSKIQTDTALLELNREISLTFVCSS